MGHVWYRQAESLILQRSPYPIERIGGQRIQGIENEHLTVTRAPREFGMAASLLSSSLKRTNCTVRFEHFHYPSTISMSRRFKYTRFS